VATRELTLANDFESLLLFPGDGGKSARHEYHRRRLTAASEVFVAVLPEIVAIPLSDVRDCSLFSDQPFCGFSQAAGKKCPDIFHGSAAA
jgi:hypothetical protein